MCMVILPTCMYVHPGPMSSERVLDSQKQELWVIMGCLWVLGIQLGSSRKAAIVLTTEPRLLGLGF